MARVRFGDVIKEIKINIDRATDNHEFYIAGEHMETENIHLTKRGRFEGSDVGPAFIRLFRPGQVLYGSRRTYLKKVAVADFEGITSNTTFVLETKDQSVMMQELLPFIMLTDSFTEYAIRNSKGSTNPYILFSDLCAYEFELPAIEEQHILATRLLACDNVKEAYKRLLTATDELVKSQFVEMFGDPTINSHSLPQKTLPELGENLDSRRIPITSSDRKVGQYPYYGASGIVDYVDGFIFDEDILLISEDGANLLARVTPIAFPASGKVWVNNHAHVMRFDSMAKQVYIEYLLNMIDISNYVTGTAQPKLNQAKLNARGAAERILLRFDRHAHQQAGQEYVCHLWRYRRPHRLYEPLFLCRLCE